MFRFWRAVLLAIAAAIIPVSATAQQELPTADEALKSLNGYYRAKTENYGCTWQNGLADPKLVCDLSAQEFNRIKRISCQGSDSARRCDFTVVGVDDLWGDEFETDLKAVFRKSGGVWTVVTPPY